MYCHNCGTELTQQNQKFCVNCGIKLGFTSGAPQIRTESIIQKKQVKIEEQPGPYSIKCLVFGIISVVIVIFTYYFGSGAVEYIFFQSMYQDFYPVYQTEDILRILMVLIIIFIIIHSVGIIFGILSRVNSANARKSEPVNTVEKIGSIFGILGLIGNAIILIVSIIVAVVIFTIFPF